MAKNKTTAVATKEVSEETIALSLQQRYDDANRTIAQKAIIFGATLVAAERELERRGLLKHGGSVAKGGGIQGWLAEHCPEIAYRTAMRWRQIAEAQVAALQSKGVGSEDDAIKMLQMDDDGLSVPPTKKALKCRDEIMATPSLRKITQDMFDFAKDKPGAKGRPAGTKADLSKKPDSNDALAAARALWSKIIVPADREAVALAAAASLLNAEDVENAKIVLSNLMDYLKEREMNLKMKVR